MKISNLTFQKFNDIVKMQDEERKKKMKNKGSCQSLKLLLIGTMLVFLMGLVISISNLGQVNEKLASLTQKEEVTIEEKEVLDSQRIIAMYLPRREVASAEVISRYAKKRQREWYTTIEGIKIAKDMDLTQRCNLSREDFMALMAGVKADTSGFFEENAGLIYDICEKYELNEIFFCGLISAESGWDIAGNHRRTHNYISLMGNGGMLLQFASVEQGLEKAASTLHDNYLSEGGRFYYGKTLEAVRTRFCPVNPNWTNLVYGRMTQIVK